MTTSDLILDLCREAGDDVSDEPATIEAFLGNHHPDDIVAAAQGDHAALVRLREACGLPPVR
jgi:hypothetical protein